MGGGTANDRNIGSWGDVVAGGKVSALGEVEDPCYFIGASGEGKATAHFLDHLPLGDRGNSIAIPGGGTPQTPFFHHVRWKGLVPFRIALSWHRAGGMLT